MGPLGALIADVLVIVALPIAIAALVRRCWPVWRAYGVCSLLFVIYANIAMRWLIGGYSPSSYGIVIITFWIDTLMIWHRHLVGVSYSGHTEEEVRVMTMLYPLIGVVVVPTIVAWVASELWKRRFGGRRKALTGE